MWGGRRGAAAADRARKRANDTDIYIYIQRAQSDDGVCDVTIP